MGDPSEALCKLSRGTKALVIVNEFTTRRMEASDLAQVLRTLAPDVQEQSAIVDLVENELLAASYPKQTIDQLTHTLLPNRRQLGPGSAPPAMVTTTRRVHSPFVVPFDQFSFQGSPGSQPPQPPQAAPQVQPRVGRPVAAPTIQPAPARAEPVQAAPVQAEPFEPIPAAPAAQAPARPKLTPVGRLPGRQPTPVAPPAAPPPQARPAPIPQGARQQTPSQQQAMKRMTFQTQQDVYFGSSAKGLHDSAVQLAVKPTVLVADDDSRIRMIYKMKLEEAGYHVVEVGDGIQAWKLIRDGGLAGIVLDMKIPGYHGLEILSRMVDSQIILPVVVSSAYDQLGDEFVVATYPKLRYLVKPVPPDKIVEAMNELLAIG